MIMHLIDRFALSEGKGREGKGREGKGREGKGREGKGGMLGFSGGTFHIGRSDLSP